MPHTAERLTNESALTDIGDARRLILQQARRLASEPVSLRDALGRVLAVDIRAAHPVPGFDSSAMDGFALRSADVGDGSPRPPVKLRIVGESSAGHPPEREVGRGEAVAIATGAMMPAGADAVVAVEQTRARGGEVEILTVLAPGTDVRLAGDDIRTGQSVLCAGGRLGPAQLGVLASLGRAEIDCVKRPLVSVITTGDELARPGARLTPGYIYDSNAYSIPALASQAGADLRSVASVPDDPHATRIAIEEALEGADIVVLCGGVSVGVHDHVRSSLAALGVSEHFWGLALRPGKPTAFGTRGGTLIFALPGNPVSAMVTFILFTAPAVSALSGMAAGLRRSTATITRDYRKDPGRAHAVRCHLQLRDDGWHAEPTADQRSHILTSMLAADALAIIPTGSGDVHAGSRVEVALLPHARPSLEEN
jgi:molybdopterin molybdotransferase